MHKIFIAIFLVLNLLSFGQKADTLFFRNYALNHKSSLNPDSVFYSVWNINTNNWNLSKRYIYRYSGENRIYEETSVNRGGLWDYQSKIDNIFNGNKNIDKVYSIWNWDASDWLPNYKYHTNYNVDNYVDNIRAYFYESYFDDWFDDSLLFFKYDSLNMLRQTETHKWITLFDAWEGVTKKEYGYNSNNLVSEVINYKWDYDLDDWVKTLKTSYLYNQNNQLDKQIQYSFNPDNLSWENYERTLYSYNSSGVVDELFTYLWIDLDGAFGWLDNTWNDYIYDDNQNLIETVVSTFDLDMLTWQNHSKIVNEFYDETHHLMSSTYYYWNYNQWNEFENYTFNYPGFVHAHTVASNLNVKVFPNPVSEKLFISIDNQLTKVVQVSVINVFGQTVFTESVYPTHSLISINLPNLPNGLYVLNLVWGNQTTSTKVIIKH